MKITVKIKNEELDALENMLVLKRTKKEKKQDRKLCIKLWAKLCKEFDK